MRLLPIPRLWALCALALGAAAAQAYHGAGPGPSTPRPRTGPALVSSVPMAVPAHVAQAFDDAGVPLSSLGFVARRVDVKAPFATLNAEEPFVLASTAKLVTSMAALDLLGPKHQWRTYAYARGPVVAGRLDGDLLIVGGGDAMLTSQGLRRWFAELREQGLAEIGGDIVLDRFAFALVADDLARTPSPEPDRPHHALPDAFTLDEGLLRVDVTAQLRGRASIRLEPPLAGVQVVDALARGGACLAHAAMGRLSGPLRPGDAPAMRLLVSGVLAPECGVQRLQFTPLTHPEFTTRAVAALWSDAGGRLGGRVVDRAARDGLVVSQHDTVAIDEPLLSSHVSQALPDVVRELNKTSNNLLARTLMLSLAPGFPLQPATLAAARARVHQWLRGQGLAEGDIEVDSGSGLSRSERGKPRALVDLLVRAWNGPTSKWLVASLPIAGVDGTLANRMREGPAAGRALLKTGTLIDARALAGYVTARSGKVYAVALLVNHPDAARVTPALDALVEWLVENG